MNLNEAYLKIFLKISNTDLYKYWNKSFTLGVKLWWLKLLTFIIFFFALIYAKMYKTSGNKTTVLILKLTASSVFLAYFLYLLVLDRKIFLDTFKTNKRFVFYKTVFYFFYLVILYLLIRLVFLIFELQQ